MNKTPFIKVAHALTFMLILVLLTVLLFPTMGALAAPGADGPLTVTTASTVLNRYAPVTAIDAGTDTLTVSDINLLDDGGSGHYANDALSPGDMILIYQAQGASFTDTTDTAAYGAFDYNSAGYYEFAVVASVSGNDIIVDAGGVPPYSCGGINNSYNGQVQVVRVPQYSTLTVNNGASVVAAPWNGSAGGVIAIAVQQETILNGTVDASGQGFRGGATNNAGAFPGFDLYRSTFSEDGGEKGESILGDGAVYDASGAGRYGRGAPANGGGGGTAHNAAGGGGANGNNGGIWTGAGFPDTTNSAWDNAWDLDDGVDDAGTPLPAYFSNGAGGGRGGYSYGAFNADALTYPPGDSIWDGDERRQVGGLGGRPLDNNPSLRLFFGGGGGGADSNNDVGGAGGSGGGLVILASGQLSGNGQVLANGANGGSTTGDGNDAAGGGGAGGTIVIQAQSVSGVSLSAVGGLGGNQIIATEESEGPGGGGGGGYVAVHANSGTLAASVAGAANGTSTSLSVTEFIPNGSTQGYDGVSSSVSFTFPGCSAPTLVDLADFNVYGQQNVTPWLAGALTLLVLIALALSILVRRQAAA